MTLPQLFLGDKPNMLGPRSSATRTRFKVLRDCQDMAAIIQASAELRPSLFWMVLLDFRVPYSGIRSVGILLNIWGLYYPKGPSTQ